MFEIGKRYSVKMRDGEGWIEHPSCKVLEIALPLIKVTGMAIGPNYLTKPTILNTSSSEFISAELNDIQREPKALNKYLIGPAPTKAKAPKLGAKKR